MITAIANLLLLIFFLAITVVWVKALVDYDPMNDCCRPEDCNKCPYDCDDYEKSYRHRNQQIKDERGKTK